MQIKNKIALALAAFFMAVSCITVDKTMGENLVPGNQDLPVKVAEIALPVQMKSSQPIQTISSTEGVFGAIRTEEYGLVQFSTVADLYPAFTGWDFGEDPIVKEVYFLANISGLYVAKDGQGGIPQQVFIHRTYKNVDSTTVFHNSFTAADYNPEPLNVGEVMYFGGDSLKVHLNKAFGEELLTATQDEKDTSALFAKRFKGLLIKTNTPEDGVIGGRQNMLNFGLGTVYVRINFQPTWEEGLARKDTLFSVNFGRDYCLNLSTYESGKMETNAPGETLYIEGVGGLKPYIDKYELKQTIDAWKASEGLQGKDVVIAKGALVFPFEMPSDFDMTKYPGNLYPCIKEYDSTYNAYLYYPAEDVSVQGYSIGTVNRSLMEYRMDIPSIIQDFVSLDIQQLDDYKHNLWIMPIDSTVDSYYGESTYNINTSTYFTGKVNGPIAERAPRLQIVYSVLQ